MGSHRKGRVHCARLLGKLLRELHELGAAGSLGLPRIDLRARVLARLCVRACVRGCILYACLGKADLRLRIVHTRAEILDDLASAAHPIERGLQTAAAPMVRSDQQRKSQGNLYVVLVCRAVAGLREHVRERRVAAAPPGP